MLLSKLLVGRRAQRCREGNVVPLHVPMGVGEIRAEELPPAESRLGTKIMGLDANLKVRSTRHSTTRREANLKIRSTRASTRARFIRITTVALGWLAFVNRPCVAFDSSSRVNNGGQWAGFTLGFVFAILIAVFSRARVKTAERQLKSLQELADHREYERNVAQQELVKRLEEERELAKEKMQFESQLSEYEKFASLAQLALGAAHEINNPLLGILSHLELERREADEEQRDEIDQCIEGAKRISMAVRGLLDYARPGPLTLSKVSLRRLADETLNFVGHQPMFRQIELQNCIPPDLPAITADSNQLSQILMNLLLNAAQATTPGGRITILADKVKFADFIELRVRDTGCGIPADILPHVFEPFFTTKRGRGTGLGLSITQAYVRSHGGEIQVESIPGYGTTVRVTLPIRQAGKLVQHTEEVIA